MWFLPELPSRRWSKTSVAAAAAAQPLESEEDVRRLQAGREVDRKLKAGELHFGVMRYLDASTPPSHAPSTIEGPSAFPSLVWPKHDGRFLYTSDRMTSSSRGGRDSPFKMDAAALARATALIYRPSKSACANVETLNGSPGVIDPSNYAGRNLGGGYQPSSLGAGLKKPDVSSAADITPRRRAARQPSRV